MQNIEYKKIVDALGDFIWAIDIHGTLTYCSDSCFVFLGYRPYEMVGRPIFDFLDKAEVDSIKTIFKEYSLEKKGISFFENTIITKDGKRLSVETNAIPILDEDSNLVGYQGIDRDITQRKKLQKELSCKEDSYRELFDALPVPSLLVDPDSGDILEVNDEFEKIYGYKKDEIYKENISFIDKEISEADISNVISYLKRHKEIDFETVHTKKDNTKINVMVNVSNITLNDKEYFLATHADISEKDKVQQEIQKHKDALSTVVSIQNDFIHSFDFKASVNNMLKLLSEDLSIDRVYIFKNDSYEDNDTFSRNYDYIKEDTRHIFSEDGLKNPIDYNQFTRWKRLLANDEVIEGIVKSFPKEEKEVLQEHGVRSIYIKPIFLNNNDCCGFIGIESYSSDRVWSVLEKNIIKMVINSLVGAYVTHEYSTSLEKKVKEQVEQIRMNDEMILQQSKQAQMGEMIGMIAHQWRQPLNAISATSINLSLLSTMGQLNEQKIEDVSEFIQNQCQKMSRTIDTFMNFVKPAKEAKEFKISHTLKSILQIMGAQLANHDIKIHIEKIEDISVLGHEDLLEQVIINLLSNARDAFSSLDKEDKYIKITLNKRDGLPIVSVEDNAGGIEEDVKDKIFNPYFTTKEQGKGTGIGLYMSLDIMRKSFDGDLVHKNIDGGSLFEIIL